MVVTRPPATFFIEVTQASTALPSSSTTQQPQAAWGAQPSLGEVMPSCSRR